MPDTDDSGRGPLAAAPTAASAADVPSLHADAHALTAIDLSGRLDVDPTIGLNLVEAARRLAVLGANELEPVEHPSLVRIVWRGATEPFILLLVLAGALAIALGHVTDGAFVLLMVGPIVGAGVVTEFRSERALETLRAATAPIARVRREADVSEVASTSLVLGDVVLLRVGDVVPADLRLWRVEGLTFDRSALTGKSLPEPGSIEADLRASVLADRHAIAYAGTSVVGGRGEGIVVATGLASEFGRISRALAGTERRRSPLQRELDRLVRILVFVAIGLIAIVTGLGFYRGNPFGENLMAGVSAAIAAIPEEPPALLAVILGLGAYRLLRRGVLVRRLNAQETLGAVDLILTDKTGTLTENRLALTNLRTPAGPVESTGERRAIVDAAIRAEEDAWSIASGARPGSFTRSLMTAAPRSSAPPSTSTPPTCSPPSRSTAATPIRSPARAATTASRSSPWARRRSCSGSPIGWSPPRARPGTSSSSRGAAAGERLLLLARRREGDAWRPWSLVGFADRLRSGIGEAMALAAGAGIQTIVVTGDHPRTAAAIAASAGLGNQRVISGEDLASWDDDRLAQELPDVHIVARAAPGGQAAHRRCRAAGQSDASR